MSKKFNRKEKYEIMKEFISSDAWIILKEEIERLKLGRENNIDSFGESGEGNKIFFNSGCRYAFNDMLRLPERIMNTSDSILKKLMLLE